MPVRSFPIANAIQCRISPVPFKLIIPNASISLPQGPLRANSSTETPNGKPEPAREPSSLPPCLTALDARSKAPIKIRLVVQRAIGIRIPRIPTPPRTGHTLLRPILLATPPGRNTKVTRQISGLEHDPRTTALRSASFADAEGAAGVLGVTEVEGHLCGIAVPRALAEPVVLEAAARGAEVVKVGLEGFAAAWVVFRLARQLAFDADGLQAEDGGRGGGFEIAGVQQLASRREAAVGAISDLFEIGAAGEEGIDGSVGVGGSGEFGAPF
jgi:hypothetical protein